MEIISHLQDNILTITPIGRLDSTTSGEFEDKINQTLTDSVNELIIDLKDVDFISSKGLRILVSCYHKMLGKSMVLTNPNSSVKEVLNLSGLLKVFTVR